MLTTLAKILILLAIALAILGAYMVGLTHGTGHAQCFDIPNMEIRRCQ